MANNYLITGYWGEPHVTAENDRGINAAMFGAGRFVLPVGKQFLAEYIGNNTIRMYDGKLMDNGAAAGIPAGEHVDLLIANAGQGMKRNDLIIFQYKQDASTLIESGTFIVVQGVETSGMPSAPTLTQSDLLSNKATLDQMELWMVPVSGTVISAPIKMYSMYDPVTGSHKHSASDITSGTLPVSRGGTGATTAADARTNLGAAASSHNHSASSITSGTLNNARLPTVPIAKGGTGATTVEDGRRNLGIDLLQVSLGLTNSGDGVHRASKTIKFTPPGSLSTGYCVAFASVSDTSYNGITCRVQVINGNTGELGIHAQLLNAGTTGTVYCTINVLAIWTDASGGDVG